MLISVERTGVALRYNTSKSQQTTHSATKPKKLSLEDIETLNIEEERMDGFVRWKAH